MSAANGGASLAERTKALLERTGYPHDVHPGQRRYGPKIETSDPPKDAEIFVGKIPKDCFEDELVPLLEGNGEIYDIRLMMVPHDSESNKGFAFVRMTTRDAALACVSKLDKYAIRPGKELGVCISESNCRLFIAGIPKSKSKDEIFDEFSNATKGVLEIVFYADPKDLHKNRGFCFIDFDSHGNASNCRKRILSSRLTVWNKSNLVCDWAIPQDEPGEDIMSKVKTLFVKHIADAVTQGKLEELFGEYGKVEKVNRIKDYAFIFFETREGALTAQEATNGIDLNGSHISVSLAKPAAKNKDNTPKSGYRTGAGNEGYMSQGRRRRGPPRGHWGDDPGYYEYDQWDYGPPGPPPPPVYDYGPPGDDYYHSGPPMVSYPTPQSSMGRGGRGGAKRDGGGGGGGGGGNRRGGRGGSRPDGARSSGNKDRGSRGRGGKAPGRGFGGGGGGSGGGQKAPFSQNPPPPPPPPQPEYKQEWNAADYSASGYAAYPGYSAGGWTEDYTTDTWQQPGKRPATNSVTPDPKRAQFQPTTPTTQWTGQYQTPTAYPATPQAAQWGAQSWTPQQQPQAQPQAQAAAWNYQQTWKQ